MTLIKKETHLMPPEEKEGVIKFEAAHLAGEAPRDSRLAELDFWRGLLVALGMMGRDPLRYGGLAFGNVSLRLNTREFLISASQTAGHAHLGETDLVRIIEADIEANRVTSIGPQKPSSETLSHAAAYRSNPDVQCVFHVHHPLPFAARQSLGIASTAEGILYGTPAMAGEIGHLLETGADQIIAMTSHQDGLLSAGTSIRQAALSLIDLLAESRFQSEAGLPSCRSSPGTQRDPLDCPPFP